MAYPLTHREYYEGLKEGKLLGLKCNECGAITVPPKINCLSCSSTDLVKTELRSDAEIKTFTVIRVAPEGFASPYVVAMAELDEGPWLIGNLVDVDPDSVSMDIIGKKVSIGHKVIPPANYTAGEGVAVTFTLK